MASDIRLKYSISYIFTKILRNNDISKKVGTFVAFHLEFLRYFDWEMRGRNKSPLIRAERSIMPLYSLKVVFITGARYPTVIIG